MQTSKNHLIAGLFSINTNPPLTFWDRLLYQATTTLNLVRKSRINANIFAHEEIFGIFNFNRTPFAPPGTRILVHDKPEKRETYAPHGSYGWYIGIAPLHYRCFSCQMMSTKAAITPDTVDFLPHHFTFPKSPQYMYQQLQHHN